ncbi:MAG: DNA cytosine methyltransferase [Micrococcales bacterium]|nr:DNA cytosine methyltransferase [Micrococcales bacterium]
MPDSAPAPDAPLRIGSLFSGYGGLDLAVEHVFAGRTAWFSGLNPAPARVFARHWPGIPNLGDITQVDWRQVEPVDVICGGFPCQDVSTVGKRAGLAPGTRSGLWAQMATAIDMLQPEWVVAENVRGLLSATARRPDPEDDHDERNPLSAVLECATLATRAALRAMEPDPWDLGDAPARPLRALGAVLGDLADLRYDARWLGLSASHVGAPHTRFRVFILAGRTVPHPAGLGRRSRRGDPGTRASPTRHDCPLASDHRPGAEWAPAQAGQGAGRAVAADRAAVRRWGRYAGAIRRWEHPTGRAAPAPTLLNHDGQPRPAPRFVEWLMGLPDGWVTDPDLELSSSEQLTALGNGVLPRQAVRALDALQRNPAA